VGGDQPGTPTGALHDPGHRNRANPRAEHEHGQRQPRRRFPAGDLGGQQRTGGTACRQAQSAEQLGGDQNPHRAPLQGGQLGTAGCGWSSGCRSGAWSIGAQSLTATVPPD
jgi:hypothetical protein